jgi:predicted metal-dependent hydrolase
MPSLLQTITLYDTRYAVIVTRRRNARAFTLRIKHGVCEVHISAPVAARKKDIMHFFDETIPKVQLHIQRHTPPPCVLLEEGAVVPIFGDKKRISFIKEEAEDTFFVPYHHGSPSRAIVKALHHHMLHHATIYITEILHSPIFAHLSPPTLYLRDTRSRWGSCTPQQNRIMLSWRLIFAPKQVVQSVILHEMAHCIHANHSAAFWEIVAHYDPYYKQSNAWLKMHGKTLFTYTIPL